MAESFYAKRLTCFILFWAIVGYLELLSIPSWFPTITGQIYLFAIILILNKPSSVWATMTLIIAAFAHALVNIHNVFNHVFFEWMINSCIVIVCITYVLQKPHAFNKDKIYLSLVPILRFFTLGLYLFSFLAKLNSDFLNPQYSCAVTMSRDISHGFPLIFQWTMGLFWLKPLVIVGTVLLEALIPILLVFNRTAHWGIVIGLAFHFILSLEPQMPVFSFSMAVFALYSIFLSNEAFASIQNKINDIIRHLKILIPTPGLRLLIIAIIVYLPPLINHLFIQHYFTWFGIWLAIAAGTIIFYITAIVSSNSHLTTNIIDPPQKNLASIHPALMIILGGLFILNGIAPYLGLKTQRCLTMFSNLRVFGPWQNHLVFPPSMVIFQQELIKILNSNDPSFKPYAKNQYLITKHEFRRLVEQSTHTHLYVRVLYQNKTITLRRNSPDFKSHPLTQPLTWIEKKFISHKPVDPREHCHCQW